MKESIQPKKMLIMNILDILKKYSDADHRLTQKDIVELLEKRYGMPADRKAVKRNLSYLQTCGYPLECEEFERAGASGEVETVCTNWYLQRDFTDEELRLLIDGVLSSKYIPKTQCSELIKKLSSLSNDYFLPKVKHVCSLPECEGRNRQLFYTIGVLDDAIERGKKVRFNYLTYGVDKKRRPRTGKDGKPVEYLVNPYQMAVTNGRYYLIGNNDAHANVAHFRVDRITEIKETDMPRKPETEIEGMKNGFDLARHMAEHIYMFSGEDVPVTVRVFKDSIDEIVDWFGTDFTVTGEAGDTVDVNVKINRSAAKYWAMQYALVAEIISPADLRKEVKDALVRAAKRYGGEIC